MRLHMPLQRAHLKSTVGDQSLQQSQMSQNHLPKVSGGSGHSTKRLCHQQKFLDPRKGRKNPGGPGIDGHTEVVCSPRGYEI